MSTRNDITGDALISKSTTQSYRDGWDRIFGKKAEVVVEPAVEAPAAPILPTGVEFLKTNLDEKTLAGRPSSLDDRANWSGIEKHQSSTSNVPSFQEWRDAHSSAA